MAINLAVVFVLAVVPLLWCHIASAAVLNKVLLNDAVNEGAVCLDGTAPGYFFRPGTGEGANNWIVHLEGGGWCYTQDECVGRSKTSLGSSANWPDTLTFGGFLSDSVLINPGFYNWNMAFVGYCDGLSFAGYRKDPVVANGTKLYLRGFPVLQAVTKSLLSRGMNQANSVILTGCSAGGLATYIHADFMHSQLPDNVKYHAIADAGYFLDALNIDGVPVLRENVQNGFKFHNTSGGLNQACIKSSLPGEEWKCQMAQYTYPHISSPIFMLNSAYDTNQLETILQLNCSPKACPPNLKKAFMQYGQEFRSAAAPAINSKTNGVFIDSCLVHCQSLSDHSWTQVKVGGQTAAKTFSNWYSNSGTASEVDCAYPCNDTC